MVNAIATKDFDLLFDVVDEMVSASRDVAVFWQELISYYRDMLVTKTVKDPARYLDLTDSERETLVALAARFTKETMLFHIGLLEDALFAMQKSYAVKRTVCEITLVRLCDPALDTSVESILTRLSRVEEQLVTGVAPTLSVPAAAVSHSSAAPEPAGIMEEPPLPEFPSDLWEPPVDMRSSDRTVDRPMGRREAPARGAEDPVGAAAGSAAVPHPEKPAEARRILRPLKSWTEAVDRVRATSPMAASFLVSAKAYTTETGEVVVKLESDFIRTMISREGAPEALRAALSVCLGRKLEGGDILYEVEDVKKTDASLLDLIIEAAEE